MDLPSIFSSQADCEYKNTVFADGLHPYYLSLNADGLASLSASAYAATKAGLTMRNNTVLADGLAPPGTKLSTVTMVI